MRRTLPAGIYAITAEKFSQGRSNIQVVKEMIRGGVTVIQYREKHTDKTIREIFEECKQIRDITREHDVLFIVNDFVDIAMLVDADGVHVGQDDLPVDQVRTLVGDKIIGLSTHSPEQAQKALEIGADYIGVGPIFETHTKDNVCDPVGMGYLEHVIAQVPIPFVAIGGIKEHNILDICQRGAKTICLVTDIVGADDIAAKVKRLRNILDEN
jgi:thiamine-phosphate pyrophosphorylase